MKGELKFFLYFTFISFNNLHIQLLVLTTLKLGSWPKCLFHLENLTLSPIYGFFFLQARWADSQRTCWQALEGVPWLAGDILNGCDFRAVQNRQQRCILTASGTIFRNRKGAKASQKFGGKKDLISSVGGGWKMRFTSFLVFMQALQLREEIYCRFPKSPGRQTSKNLQVVFIWFYK